MDGNSVQAQIRFGLGASAGDSPSGDPRGSLKAQLQQGPDPGLASGAFAGLATGQNGVDAIRTDMLARKALMQQGLPVKGNFTSQAKALYVADATAQLGWAVTTPASFRERLVWFWSNHFTVSITQGPTAALAGAMVREAIRPHVNCNFTTMVLAAERHPAMLIYLSNAESIGPGSKAGLRTGRGLNENLGRECMELHTVGLAAGYTQTDVTSMAKILTGWSAAASDKGSDATGFKYRPNAHEPGPQTVLGQTFNGGEQAGIEALTFLSQHPTTYKLLARKLVTHFVADNPPPQAVARIASVLIDTNGDLAAASAALVDLPEAWAPGQKLKTPQEFVVSALRAAPPPNQQPVDYLKVLNQLGQPLWGASLPNGWPDQAADWDGSEAILARINWAYTYAAAFDNGDMGVQPSDIAGVALGAYLRPETATAIAHAGSRREALTMLFASPEFQRR